MKNIFYYYDPHKQTCPAEDFIKQYKNKKNLFLKICTFIKYLAEHDPPYGNFASPVKNHYINELKFDKDDTTHIRILFFFKKNNLILTNGFEKPRNFSNAKIKKYIKKNYGIGDSFFNDYSKNNNNIKKYDE